MAVVWGRGVKSRIIIKKKNKVGIIAITSNYLIRLSYSLRNGHSKFNSFIYMSKMDFTDN